jgi:hypothetical protein
LQVIADQRGAEGAARIAGRRLHIHAIEVAVAQHLAVGDAIESHAARKA